MSNLIRSSNGVMVDMEALRLKNEQTVALGNMGVNARGDVVVPTKEKPQSRAERMAEHYKLHSTIPQHTPVKSSSGDVVRKRRRPSVDEHLDEAASEMEKLTRPRGSLAASLADIPAAPPLIIKE